MNPRRFVVAALIAQGVIFATAAAKADVVYTYTGNDFTSTFAPGYSTSDKITGTLTLSSALPDSLSTLTDETGLVVSYSFSDGVNSFISPCCNTGSQTIFEFITNSSGTITNWNVVIETDDDHTGDLTTQGGATALDQSLVGGVLGGDNNSDPGTWSVQSSVTSTVPEPGSLALFASALLSAGLYFRVCRRNAR